MKVLVVDDLKDIRDLTALTLEKEGIEVDTAVDGSTALEMAQNDSYLLTNAIKFSFPDSTIDVKGGVEGETILLSIRDYGIGIPEKIKDKIFSMNQKISRLGTNQEAGTGFGMVLVKRFMEAYGGSIEVRSWEEPDRENKRGTEIRLRFKKGKL